MTSNTLPLPDMYFTPDPSKLGRPFEEFELGPGDLLYLPAGLIHDADTLSEGPADTTAPSLHLTVGIECTSFSTWEALLLDLVARATEEDADVASIACPSGRED